MAILKNLEPEIIFMEGNALVPAKAVCYKRDSDGNVIEVIKPRTHNFENQLKNKIKNQLIGISMFPTQKEVFVSIRYGVNSEIEYNSLDLDNRAKTILDALKDVVYEDDKQVKLLVTDKFFLKNTKDCYYTFSVKILTPKVEGLLQKNLAKVR